MTVAPSALARSVILFAVTVAALFLPRVASAQSLLDRPPNISGDWTGAPGTLYFHFVHQFSTSGAPERKVSNVPTFLVGAGLPQRFLLGLNYSTNSTLAPRFPNEWELFARWTPLSEDLGAPFDLGGQIGYNNAAEGADAEISAARRIGLVRLIAAGRALSDPLESGHTRFAIAGGGVIRLGTYVALAGDIASLTNRDSSERIAWSAGLHLAIPSSPHTLSVQVTNTLVTTLQGESWGTSGRRYGFEFTIPLTLRRYFGRRAEALPETGGVAAVQPVDSAVAAAQTAPPATEAAAPASSPPLSSSATPAPTSIPAAPPARPSPAPKSVRNGMKNVNYLRSRLQVVIGTTVEWTNNDPLEHTVTAIDKSFNSGLVKPGRMFRHTFAKAGSFNYYCTTHPFMKGVVVVKGQ